MNYSVYDKAVADKAPEAETTEVIWKTSPVPDSNWVIRGDVDQRFGAGFTQKVQDALVGADHRDITAVAAGFCLTVENGTIAGHGPDVTAPEGAEIEMPEDDTQEPLPEVIDLGAVMAEALALALPDYPRAPGAELGEAVFAAPGVAALRDADLRPFAALAKLRPQGEEEQG